MTAARDERLCHYCGLPIGSSLVASSTKPDEHPPEYCCFGCRFAANVAAEGGETGESRWTLTRLGLAIFFTMNVMVFTMALWSRDVYANHPSVTSATADALYGLFRWASLLFSAPVVLLLGGPIVEQAWFSLKRRQITTDWLLAAGILAALVYSVISLATDGEHIYFEVACVVLVFVTLGRWLEATGKLKTTAAVRALQRLLPAQVTVLREHGPELIALQLAQPGDVIRVLPGERIPLDGVICRNRASVDEQLLTGESEPVNREVGDAVFAGAMNLDGDISLSVTAPASSGTLQRLVDLVTQAVATKGREQRLADRLTQWFVPTIALLTLATFLIHWDRTGFHAALMASLAVVLIACPCALGIATPMAIWASLGTACQRQVVFRHGDALSTLARVRAVCFDKTGTLTTGTAAVDQLLLAPETAREQVLQYAGAAAAATTHVLAQAIARYVPRDTQKCAAEVQVVAGRGLVATLASGQPAVYLGSLKYMEQSRQAVPFQLAAQLRRPELRQQSLTCVAWDGMVRGVFVFREQIRDQAREVIQALRDLGIHVTLLTGDHQGRADHLATELGVTVRAELLPHDKLTAVADLQAQYGTVAMIGDGVNDAPALATADVGIAMGCGADVSREAADVCLLNDDLTMIPWAINWARDTRRIVRQNLFWAFAYNVVGVGLAMAQLLNPIVAAIAMVGSSLFVVSNSLRLSRIT